jgi:hypothetical protein
MDLNKQSCLVAYYLMTYTGGRNHLPDNERSTSVCVCVCVCVTVNIDTHTLTNSRTAVGWPFLHNNCPHSNTTTRGCTVWATDCLWEVERLSNLPNVWAVSCDGLRPRFNETCLQRDHKKSQEKDSPPPCTEVPLHTGTCSLGPCDSWTAGLQNKFPSIPGSV